MDLAAVGLPLSDAVFVPQVEDSDDAVGAAGQTPTSARVPLDAVHVGGDGIHGRKAAAAAAAAADAAAGFNRKIQHFLERAQVEKLEDAWRGREEDEGGEEKEE